MKVVCYGDSNTYGFDPRSYFGSRYSAENRWVDILADKIGWMFINEGMNGREVSGYALSLQDDFDLLIIMLGTNDLLQRKKPKKIAKQMEIFLSDIPLEKTLLIAPPRLQIGEWVDDLGMIDASIELSSLYHDLAQKLNLLFVNACDWEIEVLFDGVHFSEKGHRAFANLLFDHLKIMFFDKLSK